MLSFVWLRLHCRSLTTYTGTECAMCLCNNYNAEYRGAVFTAELCVIMLIFKLRVFAMAIMLSAAELCSQCRSLTTYTEC